ncbi:hypothetical protein Ddye_026469 [Dipteronia dyeriana]|uniref:Pentatricopeptide repeat-containing protein n=1 Tax=Dipteronia dyeriana TaxID=168575 RepID=A0AAD9TN72_9ROSI|nr:hypothetical protein Ddye_026469 [Dipteronia dyeriana]
MEKMEVRPDTFTNSVLVDGYDKKWNSEEAKRLFEEKEKMGVKPDIVTYCALIDGHYKKGNLKEAKQLFELMELRGVRHNTITYNALIDGYSKIGIMTEAHNLREIILGLSKQGKADEALRLYNEMLEAGITPNYRIQSAMAGGLATTMS